MGHSWVLAISGVLHVLSQFPELYKANVRIKTEASRKEFLRLQEEQRRLAQQREKEEEELQAEMDMMMSLERGNLETVAEDPEEEQEVDAEDEEGEEYGEEEYGDDGEGGEEQESADDAEAGGTEAVSLLQHRY